MNADTPSDAQSADPRPADAVVSHNPAEQRYEIALDGETAGFAAYQPASNADELLFTHTEIDSRFEGKGLGSRLIGGALDDVRANGQAVVPRCPFVRTFIERHPDYLELVPSERRSEFDLPAAPA
jgi:predicted GNAT family acetyltransferase